MYAFVRIHIFTSHIHKDTHSETQQTHTLTHPHTNTYLLLNSSNKMSTGMSAFGY